MDPVVRQILDRDGLEVWAGDCRAILPGIAFDVLVTDPPYPNNAGHFAADVATAVEVLSGYKGREALVFWTELERPPVNLPLVAVHIWHRSNVNGRPYEPIYHFAADGRKRRSCVGRFPAVFGGAGPGCNEFLGHPTQKPVCLMTWLLQMTEGRVCDPFCGVGATIAAAHGLNRGAVGIEKRQDWAETAARRLSQGILPLSTSNADPHASGVSAANDR